jgi:integrase
MAIRPILFTSFHVDAVLPDLSRKRERALLKVRDAPYYQRLCEGGYLSFRRGPDTWGARYRDRAGEQHRVPLKDVGPNDYDEAKRRADEWIAQLGGSAVRSAKRSTVKAALETYLADLRQEGRAAAAKGAEWRFKKYIYGDPLAELELERATRDDFQEWRERQRPGRAARTVNRQFRSVKAGLNRALELGHVGNPAAWKLKALQDDVEDSDDTAVFLDRDQRQGLVTAAEPHAGNFLRGLELTGARPHELAAAKVSDFDGSTLKLMHRKGRPPKLHARFTQLDETGVTFFKAMAADKPRSAFLLTEDGVQPWRLHMWCRRVRQAIAAHNLSAEPQEQIPVEASAYSFRHARISELLQIYGVDPLTAAAQTGTSLAMIEKFYLRFIPSAMQEKLRAVKGVS